MPDEVAQRLIKGYQTLQHPALENKRYSTALAEFSDLAIVAYECGLNERSVKDILLHLNQNQQQDQDQESETFAQCISYMSLIFITCIISPRSVKRWSIVPSPVVEEETMNRWKGFVTLIVKGYYEKRWSWYPINILQMELMANSGRYEQPHMVSEYARVVYATLERVNPQFYTDVY